MQEIFKDKQNTSRKAVVLQRQPADAAVGSTSVTQYRKAIETDYTMEEENCVRKGSCPEDLWLPWHGWFVNKSPSRQAT